MAAGFLPSRSHVKSIFVPEEVNSMFFWVSFPSAEKRQIDYDSGLKNHLVGISQVIQNTVLQNLWLVFCLSIT